MRSRFIVLSILLAIPAFAQYTAQRNGDVVRLADGRAQTEISIATAVGNVAFEMKVKGHNILRFPFASVDEFKSKPSLSGIPLLAPFANRLDETAFYANGKKYPFNMELGNVRGPRPIHGFVTYTPQWRVIEVKADERSAWVTSRLDFYRQPDWMAQFPFAHTIEITHRLSEGVLEVHTKVQNLSDETMPLSIGFHPYFQLTDSPRNEWTISVGAGKHFLLDSNKIPTGETEAIEKFFPDPSHAALNDYSLDHVFGDLIRDSSGRAVMSVKGRSQKLDVLLGANYRAAVLFSPGGGNPAPAGGTPRPVQNFICFEPMVGITNAMNLAHKGLYKELQTIPAGATWEESFWVRPSGF